MHRRVTTRARCKSHNNTNCIAMISWPIGLSVVPDDDNNYPANDITTTVHCCGKWGRCIIINWRNWGEISDDFDDFRGTYKSKLDDNKRRGRPLTMGERRRRQWQPGGMDNSNGNSVVNEWGFGWWDFCTKHYLCALYRDGGGRKAVTNK